MPNLHLYWEWLDPFRRMSLTKIASWRISVGSWPAGADLCWDQLDIGQHLQVSRPAYLYLEILYMEYVFISKQDPAQVLVCHQYDDPQEHISMHFRWLFSTLRSRQNGRHFVDDNFKCIYPFGLSSRRGIALSVSIRLSVRPSIKNNLVRTITPHRFGLESPNLHQTCILGYSRLALKIGVIDIDLRRHFGHFDSEF